MTLTSTCEQLALFGPTTTDATDPGQRTPAPRTAIDTVLRDLAEGVHPSRLAQLNHGELSCVLLRFGGRPLSLAETGCAMNVSRFHARRIERSAVRKLAGINRLAAA